METAAQNALPSPSWTTSSSRVAWELLGPTRPSASASTLERNPGGPPMSLQMGKQPGQQGKQHALLQDR